jgi:3-isopropylmalate/(R)-2-methylmalate dehydratase large subunit
VAANVKLAMVVPGSGLVKAQAEAEGLRRDLPSTRASSGASRAARMCLAMNADTPRAGRALRLDHRTATSRAARARAAARTWSSPAMAAAAAIAGHFVDVRRIA